MRVFFFSCAVGLFTAGMPGLLAGLLLGGVLGYFLEGPSDHCNVFTSEEERFLPIMAIFAAAAGDSTKAKARAIALCRVVFPGAIESRIRFLFECAAGRKYSSAQAGAFIKAAPSDVQCGIARDVLSVLHAEGLSLDPLRARWLSEVINASNLPDEFWYGVAGFYQRPGSSPLRQDSLKTLGLEADADPDQIKRAYRRLCFDYHPDKLAGASPALRSLAEEKLKEVNKAYEILTKDLSSNLLVRQNDGAWIAANEVNGIVLPCVLCEQLNRVSRENIRSARCGCCYALLAFSKEFVADLTRQE